MEEFMKNIHPKVGDFTSAHKTTRGSVRKSKGEIVLRIVNDRLNRKY